MSRQLALILPLLVAAAQAGSISYEDCGSAYSLENVDIQGCDGFESSCTLWLGVTANVTFRFHSGFSVDSLRPEVFFTILNLNQPAIVTPMDCQALTFSTCPIQGGQDLVYTAQLYVDPELIPAKGSLTWKLHSDSNIQLVCMRTAVHLIVPPEPWKTHRRH